MARSKDTQLHDQRRQDILAAAARVFKAKGFHLARTSDICDEAGLSAGTVFRHFDTKQAMIQAIAQIEFDAYRGVLAELSNREGLEGLSRIDAAGLSALLRPSAFALSADSWLELARDPETRASLLDFDRGLRVTLTDVLARGQAEGWVRANVDPAGAANLMLAVFSGLSFDSEIGAEVDFAVTARAMADLVRHFILQGS